MLKKFAASLFKLIPADSTLLYKIATRYVDRFNGDNNSNFYTNGEARMLRNALRSCEKGGKVVIFDIGSNIGEWAQYCLQICPSAELHLFEPSPSTYSQLKQKKWPLTSCLNNFGFGEKSGIFDLHVCKESSALNSLYARRGIHNLRNAHTEKVEIHLLDDYCSAQNITKNHFMKVDVEGHELSVFEGADKMLAAGNINNIQFEYGGCNLDSRVHLGDIWEVLSSHGYKLSKIHPKGLKYFEKYNQELEVFKYSNWVAF